MRYIVLLASLTLAACTQSETAKVNNKGHLFFGTNGGVYAASTVAPPRLHTYRPSPYEPDFRAKNGKVQYHSITSQRTPAVSQSYQHVETTTTSAPTEQWLAADAPIEVKAIEAPRAPRYTFEPPVESSVISGYGKQANGSVNDGVNYLLPAGEPVYASSGGKVAYVGNELKSYGNMVIIKHDNGYNTSYAHLGRSTVEKGKTVKQGQIIGYVGQTGNVDRPQLHFAIRQGADPVNPNTLLSKQLAAN